MLSEELKNIIEKEKDIIPFLKQLDKKQKKELVPTIKKLNIKYNTQYEVRKKTSIGFSVTYEYRSTEKQRSLLTMASFVCFNKTDYKKLSWNSRNLPFKDNYLEQIIPWYIPKWFSDFINEADYIWSLDYLTMMGYYRKEAIFPSDDLIISTLPNLIVESKGNWQDRTSIYHPERLTIHKETLEDHIWKLFTQEQININNRFSYDRFENYNKKEDVWIYTIKNLVNNQQIDRQKTIHLTLMTSTYNFNKSQTGWFFDLLIALSPTNEEVIKHQQDFFVCLNSPHSKVINTILKYFKLVAKDKKFDATQFINASSLLLTSEIKSVVNSSLMVLDKIAKTNKKHHNEVSVKATEAFINQDEKIQLRAAKIIKNYGLKDDEVLKNAIDQYSSQLFFAPKEIVQDYISTNTIEIDEVEENELSEETQFITNENLLEKFETFDELLFFVSQGLDNNEEHHIDFLLSYLPKLNTLVNNDNVSKLESIFKRALGLTLNFEGWNSTIGLLQLLAAHFINDWANMLLEKYPKHLLNFKKNKQEKIKDVGKDSYYHKFLNQSLKTVENQTVRSPIYAIYKNLIIKSKQIIKDGTDLPLLSMPTHSPIWIAPEILIERIAAYGEKKMVIDLYDLQIAQIRLPINYQPGNITELTSKIQNDELRASINYFFLNENLNIDEVKTPSIWIAIILNKGNNKDLQTFKNKFGKDLTKETANYTWSCDIHQYKFKEWDYTKKKMAEKVKDKKMLKVFISKTDQKKNDSIFENIKDKFKKSLNIFGTKEIDNIYQYMKFPMTKFWYSEIISSTDVPKFLMLSPNHPSVFLAELINHSLQESTLSSQLSKRSITNSLKILNEIWYKRPYDEITYLFIACSFLCSERVAREITAELWIKANNEKTIDNQLLGKTLGKLQFKEFAPLKRFTDIVVEHLFNNTKRLDKALLILVGNMISEMSDIPIRNSKKLLETYVELKMKNPQYEVRDATKSKLQSWSQTKSLQPIIKKLG